MNLGGKSYVMLGVGLLAILIGEVAAYGDMSPSSPVPASTPVATPISAATGEGTDQMNADYRAEQALLRRHAPSAPGRPTAVMVTTNSIQVRWTEPQDTGRIGIVAYYVSANGGLSIKTSATTLLVAGLTPGVAYSFQVRALGYGWGPPSIASKPLTLPKIRPGLENVIWTFDDCEYAALGNVYHLLAILQKHGVQPGHAIFFYIGWCYQQHLSEIAKIKQEGYKVGNHTYDHADLTTLSYAHIQAEIAGGPPNAYWFRPPYGAYNSLVLKAVAAAGLHMMMWSVDSGDTSRYVPARTCQAMLNLFWNSHVGGSDNVLSHMFHVESGQAIDAYMSGSHSCVGYTG
jgi:hypothetical protein